MGWICCIREAPCAYLQDCLVLRELAAPVQESPTYRQLKAAASGSRRLRKTSGVFTCKLHLQ